MPSNFLDAKDTAILYHLDKDARQSNSSIARKTRLSKEVVNYRIKNLMKRGIIENFYTIIDSSKLGYTIYRIFVRFENVDVEKEEEILAFLKNLKSIGRIVLLEEDYDVVIFVWAKNVFEFKEIFSEIMTKYGSFFRKRLTTMVTNICYFINNHLFNTSDLAMKEIGGKANEFSLDEADIKILQILAKDAREHLLNISRTIKISPNTVKDRIKRMEKNKVIIGFKPKINAGILGYQHYKIFLGLTDVDPAKQIGLKEYLKLNKNIISITEAIGRADLEFEIQVKDSTELHKHLKELRQQFGTLLKDYKTTLVSKEQVINYFPQ
ncbi:Lrp/AsnC family transcriptional regulator [Candidatus Woesearchaeota archaeon]|nr:Lrp/AsnC family transcriptional regulator [Candidatus Woesearchaeota archaeon]